MKVIWLSLPDLNGNNRRQILEHLGYTTFDGMEIISDRQKYIDWNTYMVIDSDYDWSKFFEGYSALALMSGHMRLKEFLQINPDCKVIIENISYEEYSANLKVYTDFMKLLKRFKSTTRQATRAYDAGIRALKVIFNDDLSPENVQRTMNEFEDYVYDLVPKEQRLTIKDNTYGWEEICNFLNCPIPNRSIPKTKHSNSYFPKFKEILFEKFKRLWMWYLFYIIILLGLLFYLLNSNNVL